LLFDCLSGFLNFFSKRNRQKIAVSFRTPVLGRHQFSNRVSFTDLKNGPERHQSFV